MSKELTVEEKAARAWAMLDSMVRYAHSDERNCADVLAHESTMVEACKDLGVFFGAPLAVTTIRHRLMSLLDGPLAAFENDVQLVVEPVHASEERPTITGFDAIGLRGPGPVVAEMYARLREHMFFRDMSKLNCDCIEASAIHVDGWAFAGYEDEDTSEWSDSTDSSATRYRLVLPALLDAARKDLDDVDDDDLAKLIELMELDDTAAESETPEERIERQRELIQDALDDGWIDGTWAEREAPMMNYYWPLHGTASAVLDGCVTCVQLPDDSYGLALSGGGMDLSEDIIAAYIQCGYWPPARLRLPGFAGTVFDKQHRTLVAGIRESIRIQRNWTNGREIDLNVRAFRLVVGYGR